MPGDRDIGAGANSSGDRTLLTGHQRLSSGWGAPGGNGSGAMHSYWGSFLMPLSLSQHFLEIVGSNNFPIQTRVFSFPLPHTTFTA